MKILLAYYSFYTVLIYMVITVIKIFAKTKEEEIIKEFVKVMITVPILIHLFFYK